MPRSRSLGLALALALALGAPAAADAAKPKRYLVSLGDSYAAGYQATGAGTGATTRNGFAYQLPKLAKKRGYRLKLVNFGCGKETSTLLLERTAECEQRAPGGPDYAAGRSSPRPRSSSARIAARSIWSRSRSAATT